MLGVVLWCDKQDGKAVFWCEDQGDLAFFQAPRVEGTIVWENAAAFEVGDMVRFDIMLDPKLRRACNPQLLDEKACKRLPELLHEGAAQQSENPRTSGAVIPFKVRACSDLDAEIPKRKML